MFSTRSFALIPQVPSQRQASPGPPGMPEGFGSVTTAPPEFELFGETSAKAGTVRTTKQILTKV